MSDKKNCAGSIKCDNCGKITKRISSSQRYCPECSPEMRRKRAMEYRRERSGQSLNRQRLCELCKKPYIPVVGNQKYCPDCRPKAKRMNRNAHKQEAVRKYRGEENGDRIAWLAAALERDKYCQRCGKLLKDCEKIYCAHCEDMLSIQHKNPIPPSECAGCAYWKPLSMGPCACHHFLETGRRRDQSGGIHTCGSKRERVKRR